MIECDTDPSDLIEKIGDPNFSIVEEDCFCHPDHPSTLRISDCELNQTIDVRGESIEDTLQMATALCKLLNQDYTFRPAGE